MKRGLVLVVLAVGVTVSGCSRAAEEPGKKYEIRGQVLGVREDVGEIRLDHEAIPGFMDAMTMSFAVKDRRLLAGRVRGDLVRGTLVVTGTDAWLSRLEKVGSAEVEEPPENESPAPAFTLLEPGDRVPDQAFTDHRGRTWRPSVLAGKAWALTFIYTRCPLPTYCPLMDRHFLAAQRSLASRGRSHDAVRFVTVSFDPDHDTPAVLEAHAARLGADLASWTFVTAPRADVDAFAAKLGVSVMRNPADPAVLTHNLRTAVVSPAGAILKIYTGNEWTPAQLVADLEAAAAQ